MTDHAIDLSSTDLFDIQRSMRAMRRLKPDPVPDALITKILEAGLCAPNGGNSQKWRFLVVKAVELRAPPVRPCFRAPVRCGQAAAERFAKKLP